MMDSNPPPSQFKFGLWLCWLSLLALPVGLLAIGGGPCQGPRNAAGSAILLPTGVGCLVLAVYGIFRVLRGFRAAAILTRTWGALSVYCAGLAGFVGGFYVLVGITSLEASLRY
jgi:hypothetical protein